MYCSSKFPNVGRLRNCAATTSTHKSFSGVTNDADEYVELPASLAGVIAAADTAVDGGFGAVPIPAPAVVAVVLLLLFSKRSLNS